MFLSSTVTMDNSMLLLLLLLGLSTATKNTTEYVGFAPNEWDGDPDQLRAVLKWFELTYPADMLATSVEQVSLKPLSIRNEYVGDWFDLDLAMGDAIGATLTGKVRGDILYMLVQKYRSSSQGEKGGCCADTLRMYPKDGGGSYEDIDLKALMDTIFPQDMPPHLPTHTFALSELDNDGVVYAFLIIQAQDPTLNNVNTTSYVAVNTQDGTIRKTKEGDDYFHLPSKVGTRSTLYNETIFKVQYSTPTDLEMKLGPERNHVIELYHGNGLERVTTKSGLHLLAYTERWVMGAVMIQDPFSYTTAQGGGAIVQRFGTMPYFPNDPINASDIQHHFFGLDSESESVWASGCHNIWYTANSTSEGLEGKETMTIFNNANADRPHISNAFEFELNVIQEQDVDMASVDDSVFATNYVKLQASFHAFDEGGARPIGNRVYIFGTGNAGLGIPNDLFQIKDAMGDTINVTYSGSFLESHAPGASYDPFLRVVAPSSSSPLPSSDGDDDEEEHQEEEEEEKESEEGGNAGEEPSASWASMTAKTASIAVVVAVIFSIFAIS